MFGYFTRGWAMIIFPLILLGLTVDSAAEEHYLQALRIAPLEGKIKAPGFELPAVNLPGGRDLGRANHLSQAPASNGPGKRETGGAESERAVKEESKAPGSWGKIFGWVRGKGGASEGLAKVSLKKFRGKVVLLNFWATWCPPCRDEMPGLEKLYRGFNSGDFALLAVSIDISGSGVVSRFMQEMDLTFPALLDTKKRVSRKYGVVSIPTTFLIDCGGYIVGKAIGPRDWSGEEAFQLITKMRSGPKCNA
jgi:peroxiredoxin